jgi:flagellar assembly factor FliW
MNVGSSLSLGRLWEPTARGRKEQTDEIMQISTSRFGPVEILPEDILLFSQGLIGFEEHRHWVLIHDDGNDRVAWLQSLTDCELALPLVSPRRFVPSYRVRITKDQLSPLELAILDHAFVLVTLSCHECGPTINLRAPIVINLDRRIGKQLVTSTAESIQQVILRESTALRKSA